MIIPGLVLLALLVDLANHLYFLIGEIVLVGRWQSGLPDRFRVTDALSKGEHDSDYP